MWTTESRALVGDFGAGQALSDEQYALLAGLLGVAPAQAYDIRDVQYFRATGYRSWVKA
jgi:hypothetical protein